MAFLFAVSPTIRMVRWLFYLRKVVMKCGIQIMPGRMPAIAVSPNNNNGGTPL